MNGICALCKKEEEEKKKKMYEAGKLNALNE
jgi:hypothetical protein